MKPEQEKSLREVFLRAVEIEDLQAREAYLAEACSGDVSFRQRVERLLAADDEAGAPSEASSPTRTHNGEMAGTQIGPYKLLQQLGEGGCGAVYMAEQEKPVRRKVALKIIKLGMDTKQVVARFEAERQALAMMDHPNIARVFDAGATETGRPYFVMELVRGIKITDYCDEHQLSTRQRLDLFMQVCHAVQHAHQKGVIHRDLKPANVLVTEVDGKPLPKVIDFGIAKAVEGRLTDNTLFTAFEQLVGTPSYMSPEQASLATADIDTRTDIYSLGVMLYQLLTGETPFDTKALLAAGLDEMRRTISERVPPRPSTRLTSMAPEQVNAVARAHRSEPSRFAHLLAGDLDWIVMKCLEKERGRRYETANGLAMDVQRHLNDEPIVARPPSRLYEFQKTVRRHWVGFAATAAIVLVSLLGTFISVRQATRANRAEKVSKTEAVKATAVSEYLLDVLRSGVPRELKGIDFTLQELLEDSSVGLSERFRDQPDVEAQVRETIGLIYLDLNQGKLALPHLEKALSLKRELHGSDSQPVVNLLHQCGWAWCDYGTDELTLDDRWAHAKPYLREAQETARRHGIEWRTSRLQSLGVEGIFLNGLGRHAESDAVAEEMLRVASIPPRDPKNMAITTAGLAGVRDRQGRLEESEALYREAVDLHRESGVMDEPFAGYALENLAHVYLKQDKLPQAKAAFEEALSIFTQRYSYDHSGIRWNLERLREILERQQDWLDLEKTLQRILDGQRAAILKPDCPQNLSEADVVATWFRLAEAIAAQGRADEAEHQRDLARKFLSTNPPGPDADTGQLADFSKKSGDLEQAEAYYQQSLRVRTRDHHGWVLNPLRGLARLALATGDVDKARELALQGLPLKEQFDAGRFPLDKESVNAFASLLRELGLHAEADSLERARAEVAK